MSKLRELLNGAKDSTFARQVFNLLKQQSKFTDYFRTEPQVVMNLMIGDQTTDITAGTNKLIFRTPYAFQVTEVRGTLSTASSGAAPAIDINRNGTTMLSPKLTIDANEKTSKTAAVAAVLVTAQTTWADDDEISVDIDTAGTGAKGLRVMIYGNRL